MGCHRPMSRLSHNPGIKWWKVDITLNFESIQHNKKTMSTAECRNRLAPLDLFLGRDTLSIAVSSAAHLLSA